MSRISYSKQSGFPIHGNCANFRSGLCTLNGVAVDPDGAACPSFTPKSVIAMPLAARGYPGARQSYQPHPPQTEYGLSPPYAYPPWIGYRQGYPTPQYRRGYSYPPPYTRSAQTGYGYRPRYIPNAPRQGGVGFLSMSSGRRGRGGGRGRMGGFAAGPRGSCVCPSCGYSTPHVIGTPCYQQTCPRCGGKMTRGS